MTVFASILLAVVLLPERDEEPVDAALEARAAAEEDAGYGQQERQETVTSARISSRRSDFDRKAGVVMFEGDVFVSYSTDFSMCADRLFMFLSGSNEVSRVVALGAVSITNEARVGSCAMAIYRRHKGEVEMFGDGKAPVVRLSEGVPGAAKGIEGTRIRFWLDTEQVEVDRSSISSGQQKGGLML